MFLKIMHIIVFSSKIWTLIIFRVDASKLKKMRHYYGKDLYVERKQRGAALKLRNVWHPELKTKRKSLSENPKCIFNFFLTDVFIFSLLFSNPKKWNKTGFNVTIFLRHKYRLAIQLFDL